MAEITPNDIINKEFRMTLRGYATEQVDDFLQQISDRLFRVMEENQRLRAQTEEVRGHLQQYQQTEELLKNALVLAERAAEETRQRAHQEADLIRREAEVQLERERASVQDTLHLRDRAVAELRALLQSHLAMLDTQEDRRHAARVTE
jgi:cell division initiation protein